jgi:hypothetical protein
MNQGLEGQRILQENPSPRFWLCVSRELTLTPGMCARFAFEGDLVPCELGENR